LEFADCLVILCCGAAKVGATIREDSGSNQKGVLPKPNMIAESSEKIAHQDGLLHFSSKNAWCRSRSWTANHLGNTPSN